MKFNPGYITEKLNESKEFYCKFLGFNVKFENEFYLLLENASSTGKFEISFLLPMHPSQSKIFQSEYKSGSYLTIEVDDAEKEYNRITKLGCTIWMETKEEEWGDKHFVIKDPNGLGIDIVQFNQ